jgi:hypothetical protein
MASAAAVDYSAPEVVERTNLLLHEYQLLSEDEALVSIHKGVDHKAIDKASSTQTFFFFFQLFRVAWIRFSQEYATRFAYVILSFVLRLSGFGV